VFCPVHRKINIFIKKYHNVGGYTKIISVFEFKKYLQEISSRNIFKKYLQEISSRNIFKKYPQEISVFEFKKYLQENYIGS